MLIHTNVNSSTRFLSVREINENAHFIRCDSNYRTICNYHSHVLMYMYHNSRNSAQKVTNRRSETNFRLKRQVYIRLIRVRFFIIIFRALIGIFYLHKITKLNEVH